MVKRILVVDDEKPVREAWARTLEIEGYDVRTAADGKSAVELCEETDFDLVILDFIMPRGTGVEVLARLRERLPSIRSIIVSGKLDRTTSDADITDRLREEVEADRFLHKPLSNEQLLQEIEVLLKGRSDDESWRSLAQRAQGTKKRTAKAAKQTSRRLKALRTKKK